MKDQSTILLIVAAIAGLFLLKHKGTATTGPAGGAGHGTAGTFGGPTPPGTTTGGSGGLAGDIGNYASTFKNLTGTLSGLYDNYFGGNPDTVYNGVADSYSTGTGGTGAGSGFDTPVIDVSGYA